MDIAADYLPSGDSALLREVLQNLSNAEVLNVLRKITGFIYIILTKHLPNGGFIPNKDVLSGQGIRLKKGSGLKVLAPPFNFQVKEEKQLLSVILNDNEGIIITTLYSIMCMYDLGSDLIG